MMLSSYEDSRIELVCRKDQLRDTIGKQIRKEEDMKPVQNKKSKF
jgi:hypothetical protein